MIKFICRIMATILFYSATGYLGLIVNAQEQIGPPLLDVPDSFQGSHSLSEYEEVMFRGMKRICECKHADLPWRYCATEMYVNTISQNCHEKPYSFDVCADQKVKLASQFIDNAERKYPRLVRTCEQQHERIFPTAGCIWVSVMEERYPSEWVIPCPLEAIID